MAKLRVYELAKELGLESKELIRELEKLGVEVRSHMSSLDEDTAKLVRDSLKADKEEKGEQEKIRVTEGLTVGQLSEKIGVKPNELIKKLMQQNIFASLNEKLKRSALEIASKKFGFEIVTPTRQERKPPPPKKEEREEEVGDFPTRPPIVTVMGHVNHGKTSLLDAIRDTAVAKAEKGGITQHIGACRVRVKNGEVIFLDTPGHEAFTSMRARGAQVTDIVVLVVAADDGVMPQTLEAIDHARAADVPIVVAVNKIDKAGADSNRIKRQLQEHDVVAEELGGKTVCVNVSATKKEGLDELLEMLLLEAEMLELKANPEGHATGTIIEAKLDKQKGPVATVLVRKGKLGIGDFFVAGTFEGKVRAMIDDRGRKVNQATPSIPVEVLGFTGVPNAGDDFQAFRTEKKAREVAMERALRKREEDLCRAHHITLNELFEQIQTGKLKELKIIVKADVQGSVEALVQSLEKLGGDEVKVSVIHAGVGEINESDVMLASASDAIVVGFHVGQGEKAKRLSKEEDVDIRTYHVIYDVITDISKALEGLLEPEIVETGVGKAEVRQVFETSKGIIAGSYVIEGKILRDYQAKLLRENKEIHRGKISSVRRFKENVNEVEAGFECGISLAGFDDIQEGDIIEVFKMEEK
jgi:translation initiation factor IF-2